MSRCIRHWARAAAVTITLTAAVGCGAGAERPEPVTQRFVGTLDHIALEGGFWALRTDSGERYVLISIGDDLDDADQGRRVTVEGTPRQDRNTIYMWGTPLEVESIVPAPSGTGP